MIEARGWLIHRYDRVASTMDVASQLARFGAPDRSAVVATEQTAGRGRAGRAWQAPPGSSLFCTLVLRPHVAPDRLSTLPLVTGVAVAEAIESLTDASVQLKWPNDIWIGSDPKRRKVAGILATSTLRDAAIDYVLVGIGVNVASDSGDLPEGATSLLAATRLRIDPLGVFHLLIARFSREYEAYEGADGRPSLDEWRQRAALLRESVTVEDAGNVHSGEFVGIDGDGALLLREPGGVVRRIVAGDLTRGPQRPSSKLHV